MRRSSYQEAPFAPSFEYPTDAGEPIEIPMMTARFAEIEGSMFMTTEQLRLFDDFVWFELDQGVRSFLFPRPSSDGLVVVTLVGSGGRRYQSRPISGVEWEVSFKLRMTIP